MVPIWINKGEEIKDKLILRGIKILEGAIKTNIK